MLAVLERERPDALLPTLGGQTGLNLAVALAESGDLDRLGVRLIGAEPRGDPPRRGPAAVQAARCIEAGLAVPRAGFAHSLDEALAVGDALGLPGDRPAVVHARRRGQRASLAIPGAARGRWPPQPGDASPVGEILVEESIAGWKEFELEVMRDGDDNGVIVCSIENVDPMGVHTGDSITVAPAQTLTDREYQRMRDAALALHPGDRGRDRRLQRAVRGAIRATDAWC